MITVIGSLNYDLVTFTNKVPGPGETFQANTFENHLGGKGLNEALACARLSLGGTSVRMIGNIGLDNFGKELKQALVEDGVDTSCVKTIEDQSSGVAVILVEESGENRILITAGANGELKPSDDELLQYFQGSQEGDFVILQNEFPFTLQCINWLKQNKSSINIAYNPSPFKQELVTAEILEQLDFLIVNEGEALDVAKVVLDTQTLASFKDTIANDKKAGFLDLASKLRESLCTTNLSTVVITMGSEGCVYASKTGDVKFQPSRKVEKVIDTTGAGDTFFGGVISQVSAGNTLAQAIEFATAASALAIQKSGAAEGIPYYDQVQESLKF